MNRISLIIAFLVISLSSFSQTFNKNFKDGIVVFQLKTDIAPITSDNGNINLRDFSFINKLKTQYEITAVKQMHPNHKNELLCRTYQVEFSNFKKIDELIKDLNQALEIKYAEARSLYFPTELPNDNAYGTIGSVDGAVMDRWPLDIVHANQAWDISHGNSNIVIAILDDGFYTNHPDLVNKYLVGYNASDESNDVSPNTSHGGYCAGIAGAETNNGIGISSLSYGAKILPIKVPLYTFVEEGIVYATDNGADIISMSFRGPPSEYGRIACDYANDNGVLVVAAAANDDNYVTSGPACYKSTITVAATDENDVRASFSCYGRVVNISAPGTATPSTYESYQYSNFGGTSASAPFVASMFALMKAYGVNATSEDLKNCLYNSATNIDALNPNYIDFLGTGRLDAEQAMIMISEFSADSARVNDASITNIEKPVGLQCSPTVSPKITLRNYGTSNLQSATITYQIDGANTQTYNWIGNLAQNETITLNLSSLTVSVGTHTLTVSVTNPNGNVDEKPNNDTKTTNFEYNPESQMLIVNFLPGVFGYAHYWEIKDASDNVVATRKDFYYDDQTWHTDTVCLANGCYSFYAKNEMGNLASNDVDFNMIYLSGNVILSMQSTNDNDNTEETHNFCLYSNDAGTKIISPSIVHCGTDIEPVIELINYGTSVLSSVDIKYQANSGAIQTYNWTGSLNTGYSTEVTLPQISFTTGTQIFNVYTDMPNGSNDENPNNDSDTTNIVFHNNSMLLPFTEDFENGFDNQHWAITNPDGLRTWEIYDGASSDAGNKSARRQFFGEEPASQDWDAMLTPPLDFSGVTIPTLTFDVAYMRKLSSPSSNDSLVVSISNDCGETFTRVYADELNSVGYQSFSDFVPSSSSYWNYSFNIILDDYVNQDNIIIMFETFNTNPRSNNIYIDNIKIDEFTPTVNNEATFVSQSVPTLVAPGETFTVSVTYRNTGINTWTNATNYFLGTQNPQDNGTWGGRISVPNDVASGELVTFTFDVIAPSVVGDYNFQRRILQDMVEWFGDYTPNVIITVDTVNDASFISQTIPTIVAVNEMFDVYLTFENTGNKTWSASTNHSLGTQNPEDNTTWGTHRFALPNNVLPGEQITVVATLTAPSTAGTYNFQSKMVQDGVEWYGDFSDNVVINVEIATDINSLENDNIIIVPNPVNSNKQITIIGEFNNNENIILFNINGEKVLEQSIIGNNPIISLSEYNLNQGIYFIKIYNASTMISKKTYYT